MDVLPLIHTQDLNMVVTRNVISTPARLLVNPKEALERFESSMRFSYMYMVEPLDVFINSAFEGAVTYSQTKRDITNDYAETYGEWFIKDIRYLSGGTTIHEFVDGREREVVKAAHCYNLNQQCRRILYKDLVVRVEQFCARIWIRVHLLELFKRATRATSGHKGNKSYV
ncbi:hypothetical protein HDU85_003617 [Gaertneriomyces sp. JEL0708]|nr:hypothetical protein HDU85_003617 [Gaertneriomyces sp. JEL0708]